MKKCFLVDDLARHHQLSNYGCFWGVLAFLFIYFFLKRDDCPAPPSMFLSVRGRVVWAFYFCLVRLGEGKKKIFPALEPDQAKDFYNAGTTGQVNTATERKSLHFEVGFESSTRAK